MILRCNFKGIKVTLAIVRYSRLIGVNSNLEDGNHVLMWDFDDLSLEAVKQNLKVIQVRYCLSDIHIIRSREPNNYWAYCFTRVEWRRACEILTQTAGVDWQFIRFGIFRNRFTLRVTPKNEMQPYVVSRLEGYSLPDCTPKDLKSWVKYETLKWR